MRKMNNIDVQNFANKKLDEALNHTWKTNDDMVWLDLTDDIRSCKKEEYLEKMVLRLRHVMHSSEEIPSSFNVKFNELEGEEKSWLTNILALLQQCGTAYTSVFSSKGVGTGVGIYIYPEAATMVFVANDERYTAFLLHDAWENRLNLDNVSTVIRYYLQKLREALDTEEGLKSLELVSAPVEHFFDVLYEKQESEESFSKKSTTDQSLKDKKNNRKLN